MLRVDDKKSWRTENWRICITFWKMGLFMVIKRELSMSMTIVSAYPSNIEARRTLEMTEKEERRSDIVYAKKGRRTIRRGRISKKRDQWDTEKAKNGKYQRHACEKGKMEAKQTEGRTFKGGRGKVRGNEQRSKILRRNAEETQKSGYLACVSQSS